MKRQARSMIWVPPLVLMTVPSLSLWVNILTYTGLTHTHLPPLLTRRFLWTTASCSMPSTLLRYDRAESECKMTRLFFNHFWATGVQSTLRIAPGPGARGTVVAGRSLNSIKLFGLPRCTMPPHCSHTVFFPCLASSFDCSQGFRVRLSKQASSTSTSFQALGNPPNMMLFSTFVT